MLWRVLGADGNPLAEGSVQAAGSTGVIQDFGHDVALPGPNRDVLTDPDESFRARSCGSRCCERPAR